MAKRKAKSKVEPIEEVQESFPGIDAAPSEESKKKRSGYFIPLTEDGMIDATRLKGDTERIEAVRRALNMAGDAPTVAPAMRINPEMAGYLYDGVSRIIQLAGKQFLKWPEEFAVLVKYDDEAKEKLGPPTTAVLERLAPMWLAKHQDVAMLAVALATETQRMIQNAGLEYVRTHPKVIPPETKSNGHAELRPIREQ